MILHLYFARRFLMSLLGVFAAFAAMLGLIDLIEQIRRFGGGDVGFAQLVSLTLLNIPAGLYRVMPLVVILATLALFLALARSSELVVTRAAGRSALSAVTAPLVVAVLAGAFAVAVLNPIVAATTARYEVLSDRYQGRPVSALSISDEGLWLREGGPGGQTVINAVRSNTDGTELSEVSFLGFDLEGTPVWRVEARRASLIEGGWHVEDGKRWRFDLGTNPEATAEVFETVLLPSSLTVDEIRASFDAPSTISVWALPQYIERLERAGFAARQHRVWLNMELANPLFYAGMVVVAAAFTLRHTRLGRTGVMTLAAMLMAFGLYFVRNVAQILGENGQIPVLLAAWAPPIATLLLPLGLLLHLEDG